MQNVAQGSTADNSKIEKVNVHHDIGTSSSTPHSTNSSPAKSETETYSEHPRFMSDSSESEEDSVSEVESFVIDQDFEEDPQIEAAKFLLSPEEADRTVDPETQARLEALLQAAGIGQLATKDGKHLADPEVLRRLTSSVSCALDEAAAALTRMRTDNPREKTSLVEACTDGDVGTVRKLLTEGRSVHETSEEGESLLSLACSAGYFELAQVLLAMHANVEDRGIKGECTPLMEAASAGHLDIVRLLVAHGADVNAQSTSGNTPLMYGCAGGHEDVVKFLLEHGANVEDHNENGHTPLMEAASAGHVNVAKMLLMAGAGINTHSNEFKESALTLACYKGHLDMVRFLLEAGADQEHKTDEMHTALMEASMDGHVEVARLLLDSGAQVNMPTDSFESPLTLAACGGHVDLALLLIERGANIEEVNDEGYTPLMEAAREGHEEMVALLLSQGANINAQTDETQETALTLACCGGFNEVADFLIKAGANIELGASTPLMEAAQEGHLELVKYLLESSANVHAQTQTGDTALTYACENGHTDVADLLLQYDADLEHESEGGRTPLMKACRAGHLCTVQFLISKRANVNKQTTNNDHTPLSLACAGGHLPVVELLLANNADPFHKLKDNSTMLIEAAKGGHTNVVQLLLDYPHSLMMNQPGTMTGIIPTTVGAHEPSSIAPTVLPTITAPLPQPINFMQPAPEYDLRTSMTSTESLNCAGLHEVPEAVRIVSQEEVEGAENSTSTPVEQVSQQSKNANPQKSLLRKNRSAMFESSSLTSAEAQQVRTQPLGELDNVEMYTSAPMEFLAKEELDKNGSIMEFIKQKRKKQQVDEGSQKQQILEELHRIDRELQGRQLINYPHFPQDRTGDLLPGMLNLDLPPQQLPGMVSGMSGALFHQGPGNNISVHNAFYTGKGQQLQPMVSSSCLQVPNLPIKLAVSKDSTTYISASTTEAVVYLPPIPPLQTAAPTPPQVPFQPVSTSAEVSQNTSISDRPKAKPVSKKESKTKERKQQQQQQAQQQQQLQQQCYQTALQQQQHLQQINQLQQQVLQQQVQLTQELKTQLTSPSSVLPQLDVVQQQQDSLKKTLTLLSSDAAKLEEVVRDFEVDDVVNTFENFNLEEVTGGEPDKLQIATVQQAAVPLPQFTGSSLEEAVVATMASSQALSMQTADSSRVEYFAVPTTSAQMSHVQVPIGANMFQYEQYLQQPVTSDYQQGFQAGFEMVQKKFMKGQQHACTGGSDTLTTTVAAVTAPSQVVTVGNTYVQSATGVTHQVQVATQTQQQTPSAATSTASSSTESKKQTKGSTTSESVVKVKKGRLLLPRQPPVHLSPANNQQSTTPFPPNQNQIDPNTAVAPYGGHPYTPGAIQPTNFYCMDVDSETESNHDTALTLACAGGHEELVELLLSRGADIEHRDKKGFTPLILAATAGHEKVVEILLNHGADIEAQSERTKDTPLSLACSGGRYEVVDLLLSRNANKEHRNVSDYTPLSLAASGGYVNIIKLLLSHGAEINSRTGSKLGISPLMLAAMNGHTAAVKLLLDMGSDINAQIETNRNTALTLACFQGRHEVVSLLLDRKANVEHRAKTGLTPLMEAASGGYVDVGRVLLDKGADVNATPVPSSRDTALTIAADKGHCRFVELLLCRGAAVEVKNKKGNSPLWLAANGGHLSVVELLYNLSADIDSQDNRKVSCLMAAFRKGHTKVVKWMVHHVTQFPSDQEMIRYISTVSDKELLEKCQECVKIIRAAKETQAVKANKNASILLEELDMEKNREESKKAAAARRRERKKKKKLEKKEEKRKLQEENKKNESYDDKEEKKSDDEGDKGDDEEASHDNSPVAESPLRNGETVDKEEGDSGIDANSQGSCSSNDVKSKEKRKDKKKKKNSNSGNAKIENERGNATSSKNQPSSSNSERASDRRSNTDASANSDSKTSRSSASNNQRKGLLVFENSRHPAERDDFEATGSENYVTAKGKKSYLQFDNSDIIVTSGNTKGSSSTSPKQAGKRDEGWKEVVRKSSVQTISTESGTKKVSVPLNAISRVIGRGGSNINAIRGATGAHIEVEKQSKGQGERIITIKGSAEATKQAHSLIATLIKDPDVDILQMLPKTNKTVINAIGTSLWDKTTAANAKKLAGKQVANVANSSALGSTSQSKQATTASTSSVAIATSTRSTSSATSGVKTTTLSATAVSRGGTAPRLAAQAEKRAAAQMNANSTKNTMSYTTAIMTAGRGSTKVVTTTTTQTFAAKLSETTAPCQPAPVQVTSGKSRSQQSLGVMQPPVTAPTSPQAPAQVSATNSNLSSPTKHSNRPLPTASAPPNIQQYQQQSGKLPFPGNNIPNLLEHGPTTSQAQMHSPTSLAGQNPTSTQMQQHPSESVAHGHVSNTYSLFDSVAQQPMWRRENEPKNFAAVIGGGSNSQPVSAPPKFIDNEPPPVDASKAPGYRGNAVCSPVSSKTSSNSTTPPNMPLAPGSTYQNYQEPSKNQPLPPIGMLNRPGSRSSGLDMHPGQTNALDHFVNRPVYSGSELPARNAPHLAASTPSDSGLYKSGSTGYVSDSTSNLLKMVPNENQQHAAMMQNYHNMPQYNFSQPQQSGPGSNTTVTTSRLNPRAPDFSSSMHMSGSGNTKQQQVTPLPNMMYNAPTYHIMQQQHPQQNQANAMFNNNIGKTNMGPYHPSNRAPCSNSQRWQMPHQGFSQQQDISGLNRASLSHSVGNLLENGGMINTSPAMSPNSPAGVSMRPSSDGLYMPQPIGTERARKSLNMMPTMGSAIEPDNNWALNENPKLMGNSGPSNAYMSERQMYRNHLYGQNPLPNMDEQLTLIETLQHGTTHLDNQFNFSNGTLSLLQQQQQILPQHLANMRVHDLIPDAMKMDLQNWDSATMNLADLQDKPHGWPSNNKWNQ